MKMINCYSINQFMYRFLAPNFQSECLLTVLQSYGETPLFIYMNKPIPSGLTILTTIFLCELVL